LQLLEGGYVSWLTRLPDAHVFQAFAPLGDQAGQPVEVTNLRIEPYSALAPAPAFSRAWMDHQPEPASRPSIPSPSSLGSTARFPYEPSASARRYGATLRTEIAAIEAASPQPRKVPTLDQVRDLLHSLATDSAFYDEFKKDPGAKLAKIGVREPIALLSPKAQDKQFPTQEEYQQFLDQLDNGERFGSYFGDPLEASALSVLAVLARS
jgi:hypothetical protein